MKNLSLISFLLCMLLIQSCVKENDPIQTADEINKVTDQLHKSFFEFKILGGPEAEIFQVENSGMNGIYGLTRDAADNLDGDDQKLFECIQETKPSIFQLLKLQTATNNFSGCRGGISPAYIQEVAAVVNQKDQERVDLYAKFHAGDLSEEQVQFHLTRLKSEIRSAVLEVKNKYSQDFLKCLHQYISGIQAALNRNQWVLFTNCVQ